MKNINNNRNKNAEKKSYRVTRKFLNKYPIEEAIRRWITSYSK